MIGLDHVKVNSSWKWIVYFKSELQDNILVLVCSWRQFEDPASSPNFILQFTFGLQFTWMYMICSLDIMLWFYFTSSAKRVRIVQFSSLEDQRIGNSIKTWAHVCRNILIFFFFFFIFSVLQNCDWQLNADSCLSFRGHKYEKPFFYQFWGASWIWRIFFCGLKLCLIFQVSAFRNTHVPSLKWSIPIY